MGTGFMYELMKKQKRGRNEKNEKQLTRKERNRQIWRQNAYEMICFVCEMVFCEQMRQMTNDKK